MYKYHSPKPIVIKLIDDAGFNLREKAAKFVEENKNVTGAERGSIEEQGRTWFTYRGQEIEFYNKSLNGFSKISDLLKILKADVRKDEKRKGDLNITSVDALRIAYDLIGRGILKQKHIKFIKSKAGFTKAVKPILHPNQYFHLLRWLKENRQVSTRDYHKAKKLMTEEPYAGI